MRVWVSPEFLPSNFFKFQCLFMAENQSKSRTKLILQYIEEVWSQNPFLPNDPYDRVVVGFGFNLQLLEPRIYSL